MRSLAPIARRTKNASNVIFLQISLRPSIHLSDDIIASKRSSRSCNCFASFRPINSISESTDFNLGSESAENPIFLCIPCFPCLKSVRMACAAPGRATEMCSPFSLDGILTPNSNRRQSRRARLVHNSQRGIFIETGALLFPKSMESEQSALSAETGRVPIRCGDSLPFEWFVTSK